MSNNFIAIRTRYYKKEKAKSLDKHVRRKNNISTNAYPHLSENNFSKQFRTKTSCNDEYYKINNRRTRSDFNEVFEHLGILSLDRFEELENRYGKELYKKLDKIIAAYANEIKDKYGFEPLRYDFHLDEGHTDENGVFKRNIHFHLQFYNYDFNKKLSPLKNIQKKVVSNIDLSTGKEVFDLPKADLDKGVENGTIKRVLSTNPFFSDVQDIAARLFGKAGFRRGIAKNITGKKHFEKDKFIAEKHKEQQDQLDQANALIADKQASSEALEAELADKRDDLVELSTTLAKSNKIVKNADELLINGAEQDKIVDILENNLSDLVDMYDDYSSKPADFRKELSKKIDSKVNTISKEYEDLTVKGKKIFEKIYSVFLKIFEKMEIKIGNSIAEDQKISVKLKNKIK